MKPQIIELPKIEDMRGNLSFVEELKHIPIEIKRTYWIYDVPGGQKRGGHAFKEQQEFIISLSGSLDVIIDNGFEKQTVSFNRSYYGLYIPNGYWRQMKNFSTNTLVVVLASTLFNKKDYIRDYKEFLQYAKKNK